MLCSLHVKNLALIEEAEIQFGNGLNILSGETGAGKSIVMGSVNLALGAKADKDMIRTGAEYALIELLFQTTSPKQLEKLQEMDLPIEEDGTVLIVRKIMPNRSQCKVNGETVSSRQLKELASLFIDIHGQHQTAELLQVKKYSEVLDDYIGEEAATVKAQIKTSYGQYAKCLEEQEEVLLKEKDLSREKDLAQYEVDEIDRASLKVGEDVELEDSYRRMVHAQKILEGLNVAYQATSQESEFGASANIGRGVRELRSIAAFDSHIEELAEQLSEIENLLHDFSSAAAAYMEECELDPSALAQVEERLNLYNRMKEKYGNSVEDILQYREEKYQYLERLEHFDQYKEELKQRLAKCKEELFQKSMSLSVLRKEYGKKLEKELADCLRELNFSSVELEIEVLEKQDSFSAEGFNEIDFKISLNPGEPLRSISKVASGGELSRIMLALKTVMADKEQIDTLIFDEIDSGISGQTAWKISEKMAVLGSRHQLICITHLPQIAAMADTHFLIEKAMVDGRNVTSLYPLTEEDGILEIARLVSGSTVTEGSIANAKELKDLAIKTKEKCK